MQEILNPYEGEQMTTTDEILSELERNARQREHLLDLLEHYEGNSNLPTDIQAS